VSALDHNGGPITDRIDITLLADNQRTAVAAYERLGYTVVGCCHYCCQLEVELVDSAGNEVAVDEVGATYEIPAARAALTRSSG